MTEKNEQFKYSIPIPVPLETTLYTFDLKCCDACFFQEALFNEKFPPTEKQHRCGTHPCHTRFHGVRPIQFTLDNVAYVLKYYNKRLFRTPLEAEEMAKKIIEENKRVLSELGFKLNEKGYCINEKEFE